MHFDGVHLHHKLIYYNARNSWSNPPHSNEQFQVGLHFYIKQLVTILSATFTLGEY